MAQGMPPAMEGMHKPRGGNVTQPLRPEWHGSVSTRKGKYQGSARGHAVVCAQERPAGGLLTCEAESTPEPQRWAGALMADPSSRWTPTNPPPVGSAGDFRDGGKSNNVHRHTYALDGHRVPGASLNASNIVLYLIFITTPRGRCYY